MIVGGQFYATSLPVIPECDITELEKVQAWAKSELRHVEQQAVIDAATYVSASDHLAQARP